MEFLKFLRIFLIPIDVIVLLLGGAHFWEDLTPITPLLNFFKKAQELYGLYTLFDKITRQGLYFLFANHGASRLYYRQALEINNQGGNANGKMAKNESSNIF